MKDPEDSRRITTGGCMKDRQDMLPEEGAGDHEQRLHGIHLLRPELLTWCVRVWVPVVVVWAGLTLAMPYGDRGMALVEPWVVALAIGATANAACGAIHRILSRRFHDPVWLLPSALVVAAPVLLVVAFSAEGGALGAALLLAMVGGVPWFALLLEVVLTRDPHRSRPSNTPTAW